jgi:H+/Cl- antiporter ClcA
LGVLVINALRRLEHGAWYIGIASAVAVAIGVLALRFPIYLDHFDQYGFQINCGNGFGADLAQATAAAGDHNYVDQCEMAIAARRLWAIPLTALGTLVLLSVLLVVATTHPEDWQRSDRDTT